MGLPVEQLKPVLRETLLRVGPREARPSVQLEAVNRRGRTIQVRVSATALRGSNESVQGVILVMEGQRPPDGQPAPPSGSGPP
jgi:two-component system CheB/CheR fusion protein